MDPIIPRILRFDRFALDLTRGCVRIGGEDIDLRPKPFEVLRYLANNAGRLVPKQELFEAVWPNVVVTDDSLVQCIRVLREKLGDLDHRLIKTVPRRGYLLDAAPAVPAGRTLSSAVPTTGWLELYRAAAGMLRERAGILNGMKVQCGRLSVAMAGVPCLALGVGYLLAPDRAVASNGLFTKEDKGRLAAVAVSRQLPLPSFEIAKPNETVSAEGRALVGIWMSGKGWVGSNRQMLLIITSANDGMVAGYVVHGPAQPGSVIQSPAHFRMFKTKRTGRSFSYHEASGDYTASLTGDGIEFSVEFRDGQVGFVNLNPFWTLATAEAGQRLR